MKLINQGKKNNEKEEEGGAGDEQKSEGGGGTRERGDERKEAPPPPILPSASPREDGIEEGTEDERKEEGRKRGGGGQEQASDGGVHERGETKGKKRYHPAPHQRFHWRMGKKRPPFPSAAPHSRVLQACGTRNGGKWGYHNRWSVRAVNGGTVDDNTL